MITFAREKLYFAQEEQDRLLGEPLKSEDFLAVRDSNIVTTPFADVVSKTSIAA